MKSRGQVARAAKIKLIFIILRPENGRIRTRTAQQLMQQWKPMVAFRLTQIIDRFGYNTSDNDRGGATVELYGAYHDAYYW